jgi:SAM-dependent methyltransferase
VETCPLCGSAKHHLSIRAPDVHYGNPGLFAIAECDSCRVQFLDPMPTETYLAGAYPSDYYSYQAAFAGVRKSKLVRLAKTAMRYAIYFHALKTKDPKFPFPGTLLDIGCGSGRFMVEMRDKGWKVYGVEVSESAAKLGRKLSGLDIFAGTLDQARFPDASFDYVRSNHSFEHIHNPNEILVEIRRILKPGGRLFVGVPNVRGWAARRFGPHWWYLGAPVHTFGYDPQSLSSLLRSHGFEVVKVQYNSTYAGLFGSLQVYLNSKKGRASDEGWIINNPVLKIVGHWAARITDFFKSGDCIEVIARPAGS